MGGTSVLPGIVYDIGLAGGDGNPTQATKYVDATGTNYRVTTFLYDFRNRQTDTDGDTTKGDILL